MFKYQGGPCCEVFSTQGAAPMKDMAAKGRVKKVFEKDLKGNALVCDGGPTSKVEIPDPKTKMVLGLTQPVIAFQMFLPAAGEPFSLELVISDTQRTRRRLVFSHGFRSIVTNPLHAQLPMASGYSLGHSFSPEQMDDYIVPRGEWITLCFDLPNLVSETFRGVHHRALEMISLSGHFKLRKVFSLKDPPMEAVGCEDKVGKPIPRQLLFPPAMDTVPPTIMFSFAALKHWVAHIAEISAPVEATMNSARRTVRGTSSFATSHRDHSKSSKQTMHGKTLPPSSVTSRDSRVEQPRKTPLKSATSKQNLSSLGTRDAPLSSRSYFESGNGHHGSNNHEEEEIDNKSDLYQDNADVQGDLDDDEDENEIYQPSILNSGRSSILPKQTPSRPGSNRSERFGKGHLSPQGTIPRSENAHSARTPLQLPFDSARSVTSRLQQPSTAGQTSRPSTARSLVKESSSTSRPNSSQSVRDRDVLSTFNVTERKERPGSSRPGSSQQRHTNGTDIPELTKSLSKSERPGTARSINERPNTARSINERPKTARSIGERPLSSRSIRSGNQAEKSSKLGNFKADNDDDEFHGEVPAPKPLLPALARLREKKATNQQLSNRSEVLSPFRTLETEETERDDVPFETEGHEFLSSEAPKSNHETSGPSLLDYGSERRSTFHQDSSSSGDEDGENEEEEVYEGSEDEEVYVEKVREEGEDNRDKFLSTSEEAEENVAENEGENYWNKLTHGRTLLTPANNTSHSPHNSRSKPTLVATNDPYIEDGNELEGDDVVSLGGSDGGREKYCSEDDELEESKFSLSSPGLASKSRLEENLARQRSELAALDDELEEEEEDILRSDDEISASCFNGDQDDTNEEFEQLTSNIVRSSISQALESEVRVEEQVEYTAGNRQQQEPDLDLIYDPLLECYFCPKTNKYYKKK